MNKKNIVIIFLIVLVIGFIFIKIIGNKENGNLPAYVNEITVNEEFLESMSEKEAVVYKILNSIDFFKAATGAYEYIDNIEGYNEIVNYYVDKENRKSYVKVQSKDGEVNEELICTENGQKRFDNIKKVYRELPYRKCDQDIDSVRKLKPKDRYDKKTKEFISRQDGDFIVEVNQTLFNQEIQSYLKDYDKWNIKGEEEYLGRKVVNINGELGFTSKTGSNKFEILVDKSTGIILRLNFLNKDNKIISSLVTTNLKLDEDIEPSIFEKDISGYSKYSSGN